MNYETYNKYDLSYAILLDYGAAYLAAPPTF